MTKNKISVSLGLDENLVNKFNHYCVDKRKTKVQIIEQFLKELFDIEEKIKG